MPAPTLANLGLYALQAGLLVAALALLVATLRPGPQLRLAACRGLLVVLLLLPLQVLLRDAPAALAGLDIPVGGVTLVVDPAVASASAQVSWPALFGAAIPLGIVLRGLWFVAGLLRLRRLARELGAEVDGVAAAEVAALQETLGTRARVVFGDRVAQPVTFGIAPAIVLLPSSLLAASAERRRAVVCHELLHVSRRDWLWVLGEELVLTVLWFHPAAWWLVGELQLAREQVVDQRTVALTGARREYMDALFSAVDLPSAPPLLSGFLRRRHLARRLVSLAEEGAMSRVRLIAGGITMVAVLFVSGAAGLAAWPLVPMPSAAQEPPQMLFQPRLDRGAGVRIERHTEIPFPNREVEPVFGELIVDVEASVDAAGDVTATKAATVTVHGRADAGEGVSAAVTPAVETAVASAVNAVRDWRFEAPVRTPASVIVRVRFAAEPRASMVTGVTALAGYATEPVLRVSQPPKRVVNVQPVYPQEAKDAKVTGLVVIEMVIDERGGVREAWVSTSVPMLDEAALDAVKQWKFEPTLLNGVPIPVRATSTVSFTLR